MTANLGDAESVLALPKAAAEAMGSIDILVNNAGITRDNLFMRNFIKALPRELIEAARVEGVTEWQIFWHIVLPLVRPAIAALSVLVFTFTWNDYFWAMVLTTGADTQPVTAGLNSLNGQWIAAWHLVSAGSILAALPPVLMFFLMQRHFIAGLTLGAVK